MNKILTLVDREGYPVDFETVDNMVILTARSAEGETPMYNSVALEQEILDDSIRALTALRNAIKMGIHPKMLWAVIEGEYTGCICIDKIDQEKPVKPALRAEGLYRYLHVVSALETQHEAMVGHTVRLHISQYMPFGQHRVPEAILAPKKVKELT